MAFCFSASPLLFAFATSGGAGGEQDAPRVLPALPHPPPASRPAPAGDPDQGRRGAGPQRGRRTQALRLEGGGKVAASPPPRLPVARAARFSDLIPDAPRRAQPERGAAFPRVEAAFRPSPGCPWVVPVDLNLRPKACGWAASRPAERDRGTFGRQKAWVLGSASFQGLEYRREWRKK